VEQNTERRKEKRMARRMDELGLRDFWSDFLHVERRIDDLEEVLAKALSALVAAESKEERIEALKLVDELPTMRVHRERL
jgi:hypothetical protein